MFVRLGIEFLLSIIAVSVCLFLYCRLMKSRSFGHAVRELTDTPSDAEIALERVDAALRLAEEAADELEQDEFDRSVTLKELRRKTQM